MVRRLVSKHVTLFIAIILIGLLHSPFLIIFHQLPNIVGYDNPTHLAATQVFSSEVFPSLWGWTNHWYTGMPFPLFYPPIPYYIASFFVHTGTYDALIFKIISEIFIVINIILLFYLLKKFFADELAVQKNHIDKWFPTENNLIKILRVEMPILLAVTLIISVNPGAPSINALSDGIFSHQFAMIWFIIASWCFFYRKPIHLILGSLSVALILLSNTHAFLALSCLLPFLILWNNPERHKNKIEYLKKIIRESLKSFAFFALGIAVTSFWFIPMMYYHDYFAGIHKADIGLDNRFFSSCGFILVLSLISLYIAYKKKSKEGKFLAFYGAITSAFVVCFCIEIIQRYTNIHLIIPVQLWRWYETLCVLLVFPISHLFIILMRKYKHLGAIILLLLCVYVTKKEINWHSIYFNYTLEKAPELFEYVKHQVSDQDLIFVHGRGYPTYTTVRQTAIDAELGAHGMHTIFSNLRESSINSVFLRIAKIMVSPAEENWALINFVQTSSTQSRSIDQYRDLLKFLGINNLVLGNDDIAQQSNAIDIHQTKLFAISRPNPSFTFLSAKQKQVRITHIKTPLTLVFASDGFQDRLITDPTYSRFQEISFEKGLYKKSISFLPHSLIIEDSAYEIEQSKYIVIADLETRDVNKAIQTIEKSLVNPKRKVFILASKKYQSEYSSFVRHFARNSQVIFVDQRNNLFPFDQAISSIIKSEKFDYREESLDSHITQQNISILQTALLKKQKKYQPENTYDLIKDIWFIRQSYFPAWRAVGQNGQEVPVYLASPGYSMLFPDKNISISLFFDTPNIVTWSHILSLIGLMILSYLTINLSYKNRK